MMALATMMSTHHPHKIIVRIQTVHCHGHVLVAVIVFITNQMDLSQVIFKFSIEILKFKTKQISIFLNY